MSSQIRSKLLSRFDHGSPGGWGGWGRSVWKKQFRRHDFHKGKRNLRNHKSFPSCEKFPGLFFQSFFKSPSFKHSCNSWRNSQKENSTPGRRNAQTRQKKDKKIPRFFLQEISFLPRGPPLAMQSFKKSSASNHTVSSKAKIPHKSAPLNFPHGTCESHGLFYHHDRRFSIKIFF